MVRPWWPVCYDSLNEPLWSRHEYTWQWFKIRIPGFVSISSRCLGELKPRGTKVSVNSPVIHCVFAHVFSIMNIHNYTQLYNWMSLFSTRFAEKEIPIPDQYVWVCLSHATSTWKNLEPRSLCKHHQTPLLVPWSHPMKSYCVPFHAVFRA